MFPINPEFTRIYLIIMKNYILNLKHWQTFLILYSIPIALAIFSFVLLFFPLRTDEEIEEFIQLALNVSILSIFSPLIQMSWNWVMTMACLDKLPKEVKLKSLGYNICFFLLFIALGLMAAFLIIGRQINDTGLEFLEALLEIEVFLALIPLQFISILSSIYMFSFQAKVLKSAEIQREALFSSYINEFFFFLFFPIGIWFIQPRLNKLVHLNS